MDGAKLADAALAAAQRGQLGEASRLFEQSAHAYLEADQPQAAFNAFSNLAMVRKLVGDLRGGLAAIEAALALEAPVQQLAIASMTKGSLLDALDQVGAVAAWAQAATLFEDKATVAFCLAHAGGVFIKHGQLDAVAEVRKAIEHAGQPTKSQLVGIIGAAGESAGKNGVPLLAQAALLLLRHNDAWNPSTTPFWDLLVDRVGPATPLALALCSMGLMLTSTQKTSPAYPDLMSRVGAVIERCAAAREIAVDNLLDLIQQDPAMFLTLEPTLRGLVPADQWVIPSSN